mgnify:CR=1 FL=1
MDVLAFLLGLCVGILIMALARIAMLFKMIEAANQDNRRNEASLYAVHNKLEQIRKYCSIKEWD